MMFHYWTYWRYSSNCSSCWWLLKTSYDVYMSHLDDVADALSLHVPIVDYIVVRRIPFSLNLCVLLCGCDCLSFSDPFAYGYDVMMLNVIRSCITIKNLTWYQSYPERSLCAAETLLQLQLLKIRVSCLKTLEDKN